ncbi:MAG: DUF805 domain-containing protein [Jatrophihabitans sp.]|uniref:DUF805 domain-containing protein n=1 Tax=Jatrophihabitans sp. TaxID=1932789 RepID=UPI003F7DFEF2
MNPLVAARAGLLNALSARGRARRAEFFWTLILLYGVPAAVIEAVPHARWIDIILGLVLTVPVATAAIRRMHDIGRSGRLVLWNLVPLFGSFIWLRYASQNGEPVPNKYGPAPKPPVRISPIAA